MPHVQTPDIQRPGCRVHQALHDLTANSLPASNVKEVTLSERLGISRAPIREALQILTQDGLITSEPQKGKYIRKMTRQEIENEYEIGGILEGAGVAAALPLMNHVDLARLSGMIEHMARLAPRVGGLYEFTEVDDAFHSALLAHCANRRLVEMARSACTNISKFLFYNHWNVLVQLRRNSWIGIGIFSKPCRPVTPPRWRVAPRTLPRIGAEDGAFGS